MITGRRLALRAINAIEKVPPEEMQWVLIYLTSGLKPPPDETKFDCAVLIRKYRARWHSRLSERSASDMIAAEGARYRAGLWRVHQHLGSTPQRYRGTKTGDLFAIFKLGGVKSAAYVKTVLRG
ncbi:hypothetical protein ABIC03_003447 [Bradyrhizobium sp. RT6a]|uniref:hypothetical protein n=1 Tax=unclassified Bradyrhizobium TaxID=2631580 RepID=UPI0033927BDD